MDICIGIPARACTQPVRLVGCGLQVVYHRLAIGFMYNKMTDGQSTNIRITVNAQARYQRSTHLMYHLLPLMHCPVIKLVQAYGKALHDVLSSCEG